MIAEVVNLRRARKARAKAAAEQTAATNRAAFGRSRSDKTLVDARHQLAEARLSGHRRVEREGPDDPGEA